VFQDDSLIAGVEPAVGDLPDCPSPNGYTGVSKVETAPGGLDAAAWTNHGDRSMRDGLETAVVDDENTFRQESDPSSTD
jgi:hypothetical protein